MKQVPRVKKYIRNLLRNKLTSALVFVGLFAALGISALLMTRAATPSASVESEAGTQTENALTISDDAASGKKYVEFVNLKPVMTGFADIKSRVDTKYGAESTDCTNNLTYSCIIDDFLINVTWEQIQSVDANTYSFSAIDSKLRKMNLAGQKAKLRVQVVSASVGTPSAPNWLINDPNDKFVYCTSEPEAETCFDAPRFWNKSYQDHYDNLQKKLAETYETNEKIGEIVITGCMTRYPETFIRDFDHASNNSNMAEAGYSYEGDLACHEAQIDTHAKYWKRTRSSIAVNPMKVPNNETINPGGSRTVDYNKFHTDMITYCVETLGPRCILSNYSIRWPHAFGASAYTGNSDPICPPPGYTFGASAYTTCFSKNELPNMRLSSMYRQLFVSGQPLSFQSAQPHLVGDWVSAYAYFIANGAKLIEVNNFMDCPFGIKRTAPADQCGSPITLTRDELLNLKALDDRMESRCNPCNLTNGGNVRYLTGDQLSGYKYDSPYSDVPDLYTPYDYTELSTTRLPFQW